MDNKNLDFLDRYKVFRRLVLFFICFLISHATFAVYSDLRVVTTAVVALYGTTTGLLGLILGYYFKARKEEDDERRK